MKKSFKTLCLGLSLSMVATMATAGLTSCKSEEKVINFLNFKPEIAEVYKDIAKAYKEETGVTVNVSTAASGTYEEKLASDLAKKDAPAIFQINGINGYKTWSDYTADLTDTGIYDILSDKSLAVKSGDGVYGVPYVVEGYGIIYNNAIMEEYFALEDRADTGVDSATEINNFAKLKAVVEDMQAKKDVLGIDGVFASTSLKSGEDWRWQTHTANMPAYFEFKDVDTSVKENVEEFTFEYSENYKNIFDLYINNSVTEKTQLGTKDVTASMTEVALGKAVMVQNGNWGASQITGVEGSVLANEDIKFLPIYTGYEGEESQGLCIGTENYFAINKTLSSSKQKLADDFLVWLFSSDAGKKFVVDELNFIAPFNTFGEADMPADPLSKEVMKFMANKDLTSVPWTFNIFPSQAFKDDFGQRLLAYAQGTQDWDTLKTGVVAKWASEYANID